jgi:hypothetical protein
MFRGDYAKRVLITTAEGAYYIPYQASRKPDLLFRPELNAQNRDNEGGVGRADFYWKYPLISKIKWLKSVVNAVTSPLAPAGFGTRQN